MRRLALTLSLALAAAGPAAAQTQVDLELVLLADSSGSIGDDEIRFQRQGYASALTDSEVVDAIVGTAYGRIALTYVEWGRFDSQDVVVPWRIIDGPETAADFAADLLAPPRRARGRNAIGAALLFGQALIEANDIAGWRRIIDLSADSTGNFNGPAIGEAREFVVAAGTTINGLAVLCWDCLSGWSGGGDLEAEFRERIIGGPGAFVVAAEDREGFAAAVKRKLILEISGRAGGRAVAGLAVPDD